MTHSIIAVDGSPDVEGNAWSAKEAPLMIALTLVGAALLFAAYRLLGGTRSGGHRRYNR
jgi:hypothetical protein